MDETQSTKTTLKILQLTPNNPLTSKQNILYEMRDLMILENVKLCAKNDFYLKLKSCSRTDGFKNLSSL